MAGRCLIELGSPNTAAPLLARAISSYNANHARKIALYLSWLAEAYARVGTIDAARYTLTQARKTAQGINSIRLDLRINQVGILLPREG